MLWGRRNPTRLAFAKTTMMIESHWSSLKSQCLHARNKPRIYFVICILNSRLMPMVRWEFTKTIDGVIKPAHWHCFRRDWKNASMKEIRHPERHVTNVDRWACSCRTRLHNRFMLCKHLTHSKEIPLCHWLARRREPCFSRFDTNSRRPAPDLGGELRRSEEAGEAGSRFGWSEQAMAPRAEIRMNLEEDSRQRQALKLCCERLQRSFRCMARRIDDLCASGQCGMAQDAAKAVARPHAMFNYIDEVEASRRQRSCPRAFERRHLHRAH